MSATFKDTVIQKFLELAKIFSQNFVLMNIKDHKINTVRDTIQLTQTFHSRQAKFYNFNFNRSATCFFPQHEQFS